MYQKRLLVSCVSLAAAAIFILDCTRQIYRPCSPSASVAVINVVINDSLGGNNDGELNPNETVGLLLQLKNIGIEDIPASEGRIFSNQLGINILDSTAAIPPIPVDSTRWASEEFVVMVDSSAINECAAFLLTLNIPDSGRIAETAFCVKITYAIYACVDTCALIEDQYAVLDTILVRLSICNQSWSKPPLTLHTLPDVAAEIPVDQITNTTTTMRICTTDLPLQATPVEVSGIPFNKVFYETIGAYSCGDPVDCSILGQRTKEFRFTIPHGTLSTPSCIWFSVNIWTGASRSTSDCSITLPAGEPRHTVTVYCRI